MKTTYITLICLTALACLSHRVIIDDDNCVNSKDFSKYLIFRFLDGDKNFISLFKSNPPQMRYGNFDFQYGELAVFIIPPVYDPLNTYEYMYVYEGDTMEIEMRTEYGINHFIDSVTFQKGKYTIGLDRRKIHEDTLYRTYMDALSSPIKEDSVPYFKYISYRGIRFSEYYQQIQKSQHPRNPYKGLFYCQKKGDTVKAEKADDYVSQVLQKDYVKVRVETITPFK